MIFFCVIKVKMRIDRLIRKKKSKRKQKVENQLLHINYASNKNKKV